jgi:hypothetical protein
MRILKRDGMEWGGSRSSDQRMDERGEYLLFVLLLSFKYQDDQDQELVYIFLNIFYIIVPVLFINYLKIKYF